MIKKRRNKLNQNESDIDITSLLDVLVILLVFLLKSYSSNDYEIKVPNHINSAISKSEIFGDNITTLICDNEGNIFHQGTKLLNINKDSDLSKLEQILKVNSQDKNLNILFDHKTKYETVSKIFQTSKNFEFNKINLIVKSEE